MDPVTPDSTAPPPERLSALRTRSTAIDTRHTALIRSLRYILPLFALILTAIILLWNEGTRIEPVKKQDLIPEAETVQNELLKPVFNSVDDKNQPYTITADRATQSRENPDIITLSAPVAALTLNDGGAVDGTAEEGLYDQPAQKLNLSGNVRLSHSNGYTLETQELRVDMAAQKAYSGQDVQLTGPDGTLNATGLEADNSGGILIFTGPAKLVLTNAGSVLTLSSGNRTTAP